jgi:glucose-6-phosphate 1-dehydrogenase
MTDQDLRERLRPTLKSGENNCDKDGFLNICTYVSGSYDSPEGFQALEKAISAHEKEQKNSCCPAGRLYYLALPPSVYPQVCKGLKTYCDNVSSAHGSWIRVIAEKPFGRDVDSSEKLADELGALYPESQLYRIDHYLGKEMLQSLFVMRFANALLSPIWCRQSIASIQITFKEDFGTQGRGGYFDQFGIIRDMIATHLSQILAFVTMEKPATAHPDDIRDEKLKLLRCIRAADPAHAVLGQYTARSHPPEPGYLDDPTVPKGSKTPTYAALILYIDNDRWAGVPIIIRAGKALSERKTEIRLQLHATPHFIFNQDGANDASQMRNEIVIRLQPDEAIYMKMMVKAPGLEMSPIISELDLDYRRRYPGVVIPDAYSRLILECLRGDQQHFLRRDELRAAWAIFTPLLHAIDKGKVDIHKYEFGSRGPAAADELLAKVGYIRPKNYTWSSRHLSVAVPEKEGAEKVGAATTAKI